MSADDDGRVTLIGGGLAGALLAAYLGRSGRRVDLYERRENPSAGNFVGGRSINLAISTRGLAALEGAGVADEVLTTAIPMRGRMIHGRDGDLHYQPYDKDPNRYINSIGRAVLNSVTLAAAQRYSNVHVHFNHKCVDVDPDRPVARLIDSRTGQAVESTRGVLIGVDGAFSAVRRGLQRLDRFDYSQTFLEHGYKELTLLPGPGGAHRMEKNALHIWPRRRFMMIALPNPDGSFTCTLFYPHEGPGSFAGLRSDEDIRCLFESEFADAVPLMPTLMTDFRSNPTGSMVTVRCAPWQHDGKVALVGDAAHAVVPFYGQGANAAFEDCIVLDECIEAAGADWRRAFAEYERLRRPHCDVLADLAVENFHEMRDRTASRTFRVRKKAERTLHRFFPGWYMPLYSMVSFTRIPYGEARRRAARQDRMAIGVGLFFLLALASFVAWVIRLARWS